MTASERSRLVESLMRMSYKAEVLAGKVRRAGVSNAGLDKAANELRWAAEQVDKQRDERRK